MSRIATKRQRLLLWQMSGGACAICGTPLDERFHADHRTPWAVTRTTNVHDMQALCGLCNLRKGKQMLRTHQKEFDNLCRRIAGGEPISDIIAAVTPGGGKSLLPVIAAHRLIAARRADRICWVVPRIALANQGEHAFMDKAMRGLLGHSLEIRAATNDIDPCRGTSGFVTTYQAISEDRARLHADEFARRRYILILDEPHHAEAGGTWHRALQPLYDTAVLRVLMSGTFERSDGQRVAFLPYGPSVSGLASLDLSETATRKVIRYSLEDALTAHAVIPMYFEQVDGDAEWLDRKAQPRRVGSIADAGDDTSAAIYTALSSDFAKQLLSMAVEHWTHHRANCNPRAKLLVIAASIPHARTYLTYLRDMGVDAAIAHSEERATALEAIARFKGLKKPHYDALVTVRMAYEGLDVKTITHVAFLTQIRARPWIEQALARATRFDELAGPWRDQAAHIFHPHDELFELCIQAIKAAQDPIIKERDELRRQASTADQPPDRVPIMPIAANATAVSASGYFEGDVVDAEEYQRIAAAARKYGLRGFSTVIIKKLVDEINASKREGTPPTEPLFAGDDVDEETPSQRIHRLKQKIANFVAEVCFPLCSKGPDGRADPGELGARCQAMGTVIIRMYGKSREVMTEAELQAVWDGRATWSGFMEQARRASSY